MFQRHLQRAHHGQKQAQDENQGTFNTTSRQAPMIILDDDDDLEITSYGPSSVINSTSQGKQYPSSRPPTSSNKIDPHQKIIVSQTRETVSSTSKWSSLKSSSPFQATSWSFADRSHRVKTDYSLEPPTSFESSKVMVGRRRGRQLSVSTKNSSNDSLESPIELSEDDEANAEDIQLISSALVKQHIGPAKDTPAQSLGPTKSLPTGSLSRPLEFSEEDDTDEDDIEVISSTSCKRKIVRGKNKSPIVTRNPPITSPYLSTRSYQCRDMQLHIKDIVELSDGDFLRIDSIFRNEKKQEVKFRGIRLQRVRDLNGMLERKLNEVVMFTEVDVDDNRHTYEQGASEVSASDILRKRKARFTNQKFPLCRNTDPTQFGTKTEAATSGGLTARWKYTCLYLSAQHRLRNIPKERVLERIAPEEATQYYAISNEERRVEWRGRTVPGGSFFPNSKKSIASVPTTKKKSGPMVVLETVLDDSESLASVKKRKFTSDNGPTPKKSRSPTIEVIEVTRRRLSDVSIVPEDQTPSDIVDMSDDNISSAPTSLIVPPTIDIRASGLSSPPSSGEVLSTTPRRKIARVAGQRYTYGDAFCGAGGTTRGAVMAGLEVVWGFDKNEAACKTWRANFKKARNYEMASEDFVQEAGIKSGVELFKVDILHLSPPCQFFSPAHTVNGPNDESNVATLFAVMSVIKVAKPRVVTLEQTFGLAATRFRYYLNALIQMFTIHDFSVRWAVKNLTEWGLPQVRKRLIIIAACPGERLPEFPAQTHYKDPQEDQKPFMSVKQALATIPAGIQSTSPPPKVFETPRLPWDENSIMPRAMTTSGGHNFHPSGKRNFSCQEFAALQGFPPAHVFVGWRNEMMTQIGNAVPPSVAKLLLGEIKRQLEDADGVEVEPEFVG